MERMYVYDNFHQKGFKRFQRENDRKRIIRAITIFYLNMHLLFQICYAIITSLYILAFIIIL